MGWSQEPGSQLMFNIKSITGRLIGPNSHKKYRHTQRQRNDKIGHKKIVQRPGLITYCINSKY